jgi:hypothetical protein
MTDNWIDTFPNVVHSKILLNELLEIRFSIVLLNQGSGFTYNPINNVKKL